MYLCVNKRGLRSCTHRATQSKTNKIMKNFFTAFISIIAAVSFFGLVSSVVTAIFGVASFACVGYASLLGMCFALVCGAWYMVEDIAA